MSGDESLDVDQVSGAVGRVLGWSPDVVRPVPCFAGNQVFRVRRGTEFFFLKAGSAQDTAREHAVLGRLAEADVPVPEVVVADLTGDLFGRPSLLVRHIGGAPLEGPEPEFADACRHLRVVHSITLDGYGSVESEDGALRGVDDSWQATLQGRADGLLQVADSGLIDRQLAERAHAELTRRIASVVGMSPACLTHGDFHPRHTYAFGGHVTGIIDWGDATAGDPLYDFGRIFHSALWSAGVEQAEKQLERALDGYGDPDLTVDAIRRPVALYAAIFQAWSMFGELESGAPWPPWWPVAEQTLAALLGELE